MLGFQCSYWWTWEPEYCFLRFPDFTGYLSEILGSSVPPQSFFLGDMGTSGSFSEFHAFKGTSVLTRETEHPDIL